MYEDMTFENIMDRCLDRVSSSIDKREGSVVYDAIAPAAAELAIMYIELAYLMDRAFPDTESGDDLTKKVRERSIFRTPATAAIRKGYFEDGNGAAMDVPIGTRFSGDNLNYTVTEKIATGQFRLLCETPGAAGNQYQGNLFPIDYVEGLGAARLADILINGEDEEIDEDLVIEDMFAVDEDWDEEEDEDYDEDGFERKDTPFDQEYINARLKRLFS